MKKLIALILVNALTFIRIIGVFYLVPIFINYGGVVAAFLSAFCYFTDCLDGIIARKAHVSTFFGSAFDSIADKAFSIANLIILFTITKYSIFPILCEIAIVILQTLKYLKNANIQSSYTGKVKTWVISLTVIILYLLSDIQNITFLSSNVILKISSINRNLLYGILFIPLYVFEVLTLLSYLKTTPVHSQMQKIDLPPIEIKLKPKKGLKNAISNFCLLYLNNELYEKYKDSAGYREIRKIIKENR